MTAGSGVSALAAAGGLLGAAGVALAATAAHQGGNEAALAANFLLLHAPVLLAAGLAGRGRLLAGAAWLLLAGVLVFSADLTCRSYLGHRLFPFAAPLGGVLMIASWIGIALAALLPQQEG